VELILASTSPYRRQQLERLGIRFRAVAPQFDEDDAKVRLQRLGTSPRDLAERLAMLKAESVAATAPDAVVIGGDQLVSLDGEILGKPGTTDGAVEQLLRMSGRPHDLITSIAAAHRGETRLHTDVTTLRMRTLTQSEVERYVAADSPLDCAGSYKIESRGIALFDEIRSSDQSAITGLPMIALTTLLRGLGFPIP
jgi:septum formation protein